MDIIDEENNFNYPLECRLIKISDEDNIILVCNFLEELKKDTTISIQKTINFEYETHTVNIIFDIEGMQLYKIDGEVPILYSPYQEINLEESTTKIYLDFKIISYNNEPLIIHDKWMGILSLENCKKVSNDLKCEISIEKLNVIARQNNEYDLLCLSDVLGYFELSLVREISINYPDSPKIDIYLGLKKIIENEIDLGSCFSFETNITNMSKIKTYSIELSTDDIRHKCIFIKHEETSPLLLTCYSTSEGIYSLGEYSGFKEDNIHYKYNFILGPDEYNEIITINEQEMEFIYYCYPEILDFSSNDTLVVYFVIRENEKTKKIRFNENGTDLECIDIDIMKKCIVKKSHFEGKQSGYYYVHHENNRKKFVKNYELFGVKVILPENSNPPENSNSSDNSNPPENSNSPEKSNPPNSNSPEKSLNNGKINTYSFPLFAFICLLII